MPTPRYFQIAVPSPLRQTFTYLAPHQQKGELLTPGCRVMVPFGRRKLVGIVCATSAQTDQAHSRLRHILQVIDHSPLWPAELWQLLLWAAQYYQHPLGEVLHTALPAPLRQGKPAQTATRSHWHITAAGRDALTTLSRAPRQQAVLQLLSHHPQGLAQEQVLTDLPGSNEILKRLLDKTWLACEIQPVSWDLPRAHAEAGPLLNAQQQAAVDSVRAAFATYQAFLLEGVTGSGKTEVYLQLIGHCVAQGKQALVLVPEIGLTPQMIRRFEKRLACRIAVLHSGLSDNERLAAWLAAKQGDVDVILGTRSAIFTPMHAPGLIIIDEEHDASFKQQDGFRYSARDLAVWRAHHNHIPIVLGSATPAIESLYNVSRERFQLLQLTERAGGARAPRLHLLDVRAQPMHEGVSDRLLQLMRQHLENNNQVLLFLNRRGFAPTLMCHDCGWIATCQRCDSHMTYYQRDQRLRCHHCGAERRAEQQCTHCASENLLTVGAGTERIETALRERFTDTEIIRIDRDTTRRRGSLEDLLHKIKNGRRQILIGTQMLAKGHHFPNVTLVGILDADQGLHSAEFRAPERMAQLILQVAGRAGRAEQPGEVIIQTHHPDHPLLLSLIREGYNAFARALLQERQAAALPPYTAMAIFRAEAVEREAPLGFLERARAILQTHCDKQVNIFGPLPAPMEKRAGRYRAQLIVQAAQRPQLQHVLAAALPQIESAKTGKVRWSIDVDPIDTY
ncbi:MAG: primosomal protein N' [Gammaproteobacteria bacterium]|nr:primosomal protein N' [Gammaproteobacteria bacterium]